jgi:class 3 adenylate cyclase/tetratricopeptide (TPR) repeat protein
MRWEVAMQCPNCGTGGLGLGQQCSVCGAFCDGSCKHCGFTNQPVARFCGGCGRPTTRPAALGYHALSFLQSNVPPVLVDRILRSGSAMLGERKHVTVLFADVRGSTALIDKLDPEQALEILAPVLKLLMDAVHQHEGFVNQSRGDGIMALFGAPIASEDHAVQACRAALAMRAAVGTLRQKDGSDIAIRVGMNSGHVVIHSIGSDLAMNYDAVGKTVHLAARMETLAAPGSIVLSSATHDLAKGFIAAASKGAVAPKGISEPVEAFELTGMRLRTRWQVRSARGLSAIVGRQSELRTLRRALESAAAGEGQFVTVTGAAGLGKSRLVHEFIRFVAHDWALLETACASQRTSSSYYPVSTLIRASFKIGIDDGPDVVLRRVTEAMDSLDPALRAFLPAILSLLDVKSDDRDWNKLEPAERRQQVIEAVKALVLDQERSTPLLILIEDLHWVDVETRLILENLVGILRKARILLVATQRPDGAAAAPDYPHVRLDVARLDDDASRQLVDWLMGDDIGLTQVKRRILAQAHGNPLFIEELVQALRDTKTLEGRPGDHRLSKASQRVDIPETIHSVLAARIDLLAGLPKSLLQTSAVIGREVPLALLSGMVGIAPAELALHCETLEAADFLYKASSDMTPQYSFKHDLTREVAYGTILVGVRRTLHAKAVEIIESIFSSRLDEHIDRLADHAFRAELWEKAIPYQLRSCRRAVRRGANHDAISIFERGLETLSHLPPSDTKNKAQIDFRLTVIIALEPLGRHRRIAQVLREARAFAETSGDPWRTTAVNCQLGVALWRLGEHESAMAAAEAASALADGIGDPTLIFASRAIVGMVHHEVGAFAQAVELHEKCLTLETPDLDERRAGWAAYPSVILRTFLADSWVDLGELDKAEEIAEDAGRRAEAADHAYSRANINHVRARIRMAQGRHAEALALLRDTWQICLDLEMAQMYPIFAARMGEAYLGVGEVEAALEILSVPERLDVPLAEHAFGWRYLFLAQGRALLAVGRHAEARSVAERALALAESRGEPPQMAYANMLLGDIAAASDDRTAAETHFRRACDLAQVCSMRPLAEGASAALARASRDGKAGLSPPHRARERSALMPGMKK